jgi:hypothetical protein
MSLAIGLTAGLVLPTQAAPSDHKAKRATAYALEAFGYGSRVVGGDVPAGSDRSAFQVIGCTNKAGISRRNAKANVDLGGGLSLSGVKTRVWTSDKGGRVMSSARHTIAEVKVVNLPTAKLTLRGVASTAQAWHDSDGFHSTATADIARITLRPIGEVAVNIPVPDSGNSVHIPGVGQLALGAGTRRSDADGAQAVLDAVKLHVNATDTTVYLAHARASISGGVKQHLFAGSAFGTKVDLLERTAASDETPFLVMPCEGTGGTRVDRAIAHANLRAGLEARALDVSQKSASTGGHAYAWERSTIGKVALGHRLVIKGVVAKASAERSGGTLTTSSRGTTLAKVFYRGDRLHFPAHGALRIAGLAKIEPRLVRHIHGGIDVTALRVTLLDGRLAQVDIGHARVRITRSGL